MKILTPKTFYSMCLLLLVCGQGCASHSKSIRPNYIRHGHIFPPGVYQHAVDLTIRGKQRFQFNGVVKITPTEIQVIGLSHFDITVFKIADDLRTGRIHTEIYIERLEPYESQLVQIYLMIKKLLVFKVSRPIREGGSIRPDKETLFAFGKYDKHRIPETVCVMSPKFVANIEVIGYEIK